MKGKKRVNYGSIMAKNEETACRITATQTDDVRHASLYFPFLIYLLTHILTEEGDVEDLWLI